MMPCGGGGGGGCGLRLREIQTWIRDYDNLQWLALKLIYAQIGCALIGSLGPLYNGVLLVDLGISLFALVAIESSSQSLARTYALLLFCSICLDLSWFFIFSHHIWNIPSELYGAFGSFLVKLTLAMQIIGSSVRLSSSLLWIQMYRLGSSYTDNNSGARDMDVDLRNSFINPATPIVRIPSGCDDVVRGSIYDPAYYSSLFENGLDDTYTSGVSQNREISAVESGSAAETSQLNPPMCRSFHGKDFTLVFATTMDEGEVSRYWCHMCSQTVNPIIEIDTIKCPICQSGFVEEMPSAPTPGNDTPLDFELGPSDPDRALSLWAPILLGMMGNSRRRRRRPIRRVEFEDENNENNHRSLDDETDFDPELESIMRRRRRNSATILRLVQDMRAGILSESGDFETDERTRERVILINPFNQTIIVQGSYDPNNDGSQNRAAVGSLGDYFVGPGLDLLLQHLSENDPNRYGTPPAQKEAVEALPDVKIEETVQCSVCLDDCEVGVEVKEMPCKHKFHGKCILPWLELHSSCPVCRCQLPCDESKINLEGSRNNSNEEGNNNNNNNNNNDVGDGGDESGRQFSVPLPWPFSGLFSPSSSSSRSSGGNSTSGSSRDVNARRENEN